MRRACAAWTLSGIPPDTRAEMGKENLQVPELLERDAWVVAVKADPTAHLGLRKNGAGTRSSKLNAEAIKALGLLDQQGKDAQEGYVFDWTMSSERQDRDRDIIEVAGWGWTDFLRTGAGPILLCHGSWGVPIAKMPRVSKDSGTLDGVLQFPTMDEAPSHTLAHTCREMIAFDALTMGSVGFYPIEWTYDEDIKGIRFKKQDLLEFSVCAVPSNPDAVRRAKSAGVNVAPLRAWAEQALDILDVAERTVDPLQEIWKATGARKVWIEGKGGILIPFEKSDDAPPAEAAAAEAPPTEVPPAAEEAPAEAPPVVEAAPAVEPAPVDDEQKFADALLAEFGLSPEEAKAIIGDVVAERRNAHYIATKTPLTGKVPA
jgi:hypothetical protein